MGVSLILIKVIRHLFKGLSVGWSWIHFRLKKIGEINLCLCVHTRVCVCLSLSLYVFIK